MMRSPEDLEPGIEASRQALARDVAALRERATPRRLMGDAVETVRLRGRQAGDRLIRTAGSNPVWVSVIGSGILAGAGVGIWLLVRSRAAARRDTVGANLARAAEPIGAILAGGVAWMLARRRRLARRDAIVGVLARAAEPVRPLLRRVSPQKQGLRSFLTLPRLH